jgi:putative FmdB family regulatory protein
MMPIYEYQCGDCQTVFETLITSTAAGKEIVCSRCKSTNVKKIMSGSSFKRATGSAASACGLSGCASRKGFS